MTYGTDSKNYNIVLLGPADATSRMRGYKQFETQDSRPLPRRRLWSPLIIEAHAASVQDRDGAPAVIAALLGVAVCVKKLFADSGYAGPKLQDVSKELSVSELIEIVPSARAARNLWFCWVVK